MQFAWLILIPVTLGNIVQTGVIYLAVSNFGMSKQVFLIVTGVINWVLLFGFIRIISRATVVSTRHAQAPALQAVAHRWAVQVGLAQHIETI